MSNIIINDFNNIIGYYKDIKDYIKESIKESLDQDYYDHVIELSELMTDLLEYKESENLLEVSENNGMGITISEIKKGE